MSADTAQPLRERRAQRLMHRAAHATRMGWYAGLYRLSRSLTTPTPAAPGVAERMPPPAQLRADLLALIEQDLAHIEAGLYRMPEEVVPGPAALRQAARYLADLRAVDRRRRAGDGQEVFRARGDRRLNFLLELDLGLALLIGQLHLIERVPLLLEHELRSRGRRRGN